MAALVTVGNWNLALPALYDDGTDGDLIVNDGVFSVIIQLPDSSGDGKIVFSVLDTQNIETQSDTLTFTANFAGYELLPKKVMVGLG